MGETRVDLLHLLEDLADAYPGELEETVLTEIVANALDSGATTIACATNAEESALTISDDGSGMRRADLRRFHDLATSSKERGSGIGFAGVGIKLGLLVSDEVITETRRGAQYVATSWALTNRRRAPWRWVEPMGIVGEQGTAVRLRLANPLSALLDPGYLESALRRHFEPLFDAYFQPILRAHYPRGVRFVVNDRELATIEAGHGSMTLPLELRLPRKRTPSAFGYVSRAAEPIAEERRGIAVSTFGKVIKRGWDWLGLTPAAADRVVGLVEIPALAATLTLNKADFIRAGPRGALYLSYRKALQEAVSARLAEWGDVPDDSEGPRRRAARPVERDLEAILADLAADFPMLATLVERRAGGTRRMPVGTARDAGTGGEAVGDLFAQPSDSAPEASEPASAPGAEQANRPGEAAREPAATPMPEAERDSGRRTRRPLRLGLTIQFEPRPDDPALARLVESTVWVNSAHPAHSRAVASRSEGYHLALSVAMALADVAVEPAQVAAFVTEFLSRWGASTGRRPVRGRGRRGRRA